jgi:hypothetical protein
MPKQSGMTTPVGLGNTLKFSLRSEFLINPLIFQIFSTVSLHLEKSERQVKVKVHLYFTYRAFVCIVWLICLNLFWNQEVYLGTNFAEELNKHFDKVNKIYTSSFQMFWKWKCLVHGIFLLNNNAYFHFKEGHNFCLPNFEVMSEDRFPVVDMAADVLLQMRNEYHMFCDLEIYLHSPFILCTCRLWPTHSTRTFEFHPSQKKITYKMNNAKIDELSWNHLKIG